MLIRPKWFRNEKQQVDVRELEGDDSEPQPQQEPEQQSDEARHTSAKAPLPARPSNPFTIAYQATRVGKWLRAYREDAARDSL